MLKHSFTSSTAFICLWLILYTLISSELSSEKPFFLNSLWCYKCKWRLLSKPIWRHIGRGEDYLFHEILEIILFNFFNNRNKIISLSENNLNIVYMPIKLPRKPFAFRQSPPKPVATNVFFTFIRLEMLKSSKKLPSPPIQCWNWTSWYHVLRLQTLNQHCRWGRGCFICIFLN